MKKREGIVIASCKYDHHLIKYASPIRTRNPIAQNISITMPATSL